MKLNRICRLCALAASVASVEASAQSLRDRSFYVGTSVGAIAIEPEGVSGTDNSRTNSARASLGVFGGARLGVLPIAQGIPVFAEIGYQDIARHTVPYKTRNGTSDLTASGHSTYAAAKIDFWRPGNFALYGKLGAALNSVEGSTRPGQTRIPINGSRVGLLWGVGGQYDFDSGLSLRVELTSYGETSSKSSAAGVNLGLAYRF